LAEECVARWPIERYIGISNPLRMKHPGQSDRRQRACLSRDPDPCGFHNARIVIWVGVSVQLGLASPDRARRAGVAPRRFPPT